VRDEIHFENVALDPVHGQADPIDANGAFAGDVAFQVRRGTNLKQAVRELQHFAYSVDVPGDQVAAEAPAHGERLLQVHLARSVQPRGDAQRFARHVGRKSTRDRKSTRLNSSH